MRSYKQRKHQIAMMRGFFTSAGRVQPARRKPSPRKLEVSEVVALLKSRKVAVVPHGA